MEKPEASRKEFIERAAFNYIRAMEQMDADAVAEIHEQALTDPELAQIIDEIDLAYQEEEGAFASDADINLLRDLLQKHFVSAALPDEDYESPLNVGQIAARLQLERNLSASDKEVNRALLISTLALPAKLTNQTVSELAAQLGVTASERYWRMFRDKAILMAMGHSQGKARMAARKAQKRDQH
jgi:hypothetical protein